MATSSHAETIGTGLVSILGPMATHAIRLIGDPVLKQRASEVTDIDGSLVRLVEDMVTTMYEAPGIGLAAPQVGVQKRLFVYDLHDGEGPRAMVNPEIHETRGEWTYEEGCLSVPGLSWEIIRPNEVHIVGRDLDGNEVDLEVDELAGRLFQHELDHLDGVLLIERLDPDQRKLAKRAIREALFDDGPVEPAPHRGLSLS
jgi:peptide deformylase